MSYAKHNQAHLYMSAILRELWAAPFMTAKQWGHHASNILEPFNGLLEKGRLLPVLDLLDALWTRFMITRFKRMQAGYALLDSGNGEDNTEFDLKTLAESLENSQHRQVYLANLSHGQVHSFSGDSYIADLTKPTRTDFR